MIKYCEVDGLLNTMKASTIFNSVIAFFTANNSSSIRDAYSTTSSVQSLNKDLPTEPHREPPRPKMMSCDSDEQCPEGSMCITLVGSYGICVVTETS